MTSRNSFLGLLTAQLLLTVAVAGFLFGVKSIQMYINSHIWVIVMALIGTFVFLIILMCVPNMINKHPQNLILLFSFTALEGVLIGAISSVYEINEVLIAAGITIAVTIGLTLFALQTKIDFTLYSGVLFSILIILFVFGFFSIFFRNSIISLVYAAVGALLFSAYLVYDVQLIAGGRKYELGPDDYVAGALMVYLDIINLFLMILRLVGGRD